MVQAGCEGMIDYSKADVLDPRWWKKMMAVYDHCYNKVVTRLNEYKFQLNLSVLDYTAEFDTFTLHWNQADMLRNRLVASNAPWIDTGPQSADEMMEQMRETYIEHFGDPQDPEYKAEIQKLIDHWQGDK